MEQYAAAQSLSWIARVKKRLRVQRKRTILHASAVPRQPCDRDVGDRQEVRVRLQSDCDHVAIPGEQTAEVDATLQKPRLVPTFEDSFVQIRGFKVDAPLLLQPRPSSIACARTRIGLHLVARIDRRWAPNRRVWHRQRTDRELWERRCDGLSAHD
eukprot:1044036-Rhodomonas_salina.3